MTFVSKPPALQDLSDTQADRLTRGLLTMLACAGLIILSAKWMLIDHLGMNVPYLDQWDVEAKDFSRFVSGQLHWADLFTLHNEHCIFTTRLWNLAWYVANSQMWDVRLQMVVNAIVHTMALLLVCRATIDSARPRIWLPSVIVLLAVGVIPIGWTNLLGGFQVQFYWALLFQVMAMLLWLGRRPLSWPWWAGFLSYGLALVSMGSGGMIAFAVAVVLAGRAWKNRHTASGIAAGVLLIAGLGYMVWVISQSIEAHAHLKAQSIGEFLAVFLKGMSAPYMGEHWPAFVLWLPLLVLMGRILLKRQPMEPIDERLITLGLWVAALAVAVAYARGENGASPSSRYLDNQVLALLVNVSCLTRLGWMIPWRRPCACIQPAALLLAGWLIVAGGGYIQSSHFVNPINQSLQGWIIGQLNWQAKSDKMASNIHGYLSTQDMRYLTSRGSIPMIGLPEVQKLKAQDAAVVNVLPSAIQPVMAPKLVQTTGKGLWTEPQSDGQMLNTTPFGVTPALSKAQEGRVDLLYEFPAHIRHFVVQVLMLPPNAADLALYSRSGSESQTLIAPKTHSHIYRGSLYFHTPNSTFTLEIVDHGQSPGGALSITSPIPLGPISYWMERLLPWTPLMGITGFIGMLYCCWYLGSLISVQRTPS